MKWINRKELVKSTVLEFIKEESLLHGAALAFYSLLALVPLLYLCVTYFGMVVGSDVMIEIIVFILEDRVGLVDSGGIIEFLNELNLKNSSVLLEFVSILVLTFSCTVIFNSLKRSLNEFYDIKTVYSGRRKRIIRTIIARLVSVGFIVGFVALLIVFYFAQMLFLTLGDYFFDGSERVDWLFSGFAKHVIPIFTNIIVISFIFKYLNDGVVAWDMAIRGSLITSILLYVGQILINFYLGHFFFAASGGVAGAILALLVWVYYSSQIIFFGAKYIAVLSRMKGKPILFRD